MLGVSCENKSRGRGGEHLNKNENEKGTWEAKSGVNGETGGPVVKETGGKDAQPFQVSEGR